MANELLIAKASKALDRALRGDREVISFFQRLRTKAMAGDAECRALHNTLAALYWQQRVTAKKYANAERFYFRLLRSDPAARRRLGQLVASAKAGDPDAIYVFRVLKSVHHKYKASAWSGPGAPRIGGYGMPRHHRAGIIFAAPHHTGHVGPIHVGAAVCQLDAAGHASLLALIRAARMSLPHYANGVDDMTSMSAPSLSQPGSAKVLQRLTQVHATAPTAPLLTQRQTSMSRFMTTTPRPSGITFSRAGL